MIVFKLKQLTKHKKYVPTQNFEIFEALKMASIKKRVRIYSSVLRHKRHTAQSDYPERAKLR